MHVTLQIHKAHRNEHQNHWVIMHTEINLKITKPANFAPLETASLSQYNQNTMGAKCPNEKWRNEQVTILWIEMKRVFKPNVHQK